MKIVDINHSNDSVKSICDSEATLNEEDVRNNEFVKSSPKFILIVDDEVFC